MPSSERDRGSKRGLASADAQTRKRVARAGGEAPHEERGLQAADEQTRERVAREGGQASHGGGSSNEGSQGGSEKRGYASRSEEESA
ncbi:hypothetical protein NTE_02136 [Candidatus Nitrososphaera evergladensis SR1]|uniref:Stress-induced acidophilic repeat motif-containing protein n=1 Tax=Candidatus Nitrososphaera evergladensis SR1 TaxID=1459636 RepID=A0A075MSR7_9ARCH|nr:hypothetical protein [Candidatus Nitrososphaera evergladensis]AIF84190.1 hypothetical protein NTE_02136 [Candidatus Nitrososphaera evergladensis SR1]